MRSIPGSRLNLQLELECAGSGASLGRLTALCSSLGSARDQRQGALEQLHAKHKRILEFTQVAVSGCHYCVLTCYYF